MSRLRHLVDAGWLAEHLDDADLRVFDCTTKLGPPPPDTGHPYEVISGRADYETGHIPNAAFLDIQGELSDPASPLLFAAPSAERFAGAMSRHGVGPGSFVVLYSAGTPPGQRASGGFSVSSGSTTPPSSTVVGSSGRPRGTRSTSPHRPTP